MLPILRFQASSARAWAFVAATLAITFRYFHFIAGNAVNVLFYDQWDFLNPFFGVRLGAVKLFLAQHGPHREGLGLIADWILYPLTRWNTRAEAFMIGGFILTAMAVALWIKQRLFGRLGYCDLAIPLMFLSLRQFETLIGTPNPAYSAIPLLLVMLYCLALIQPRQPRRLSLLLVLNIQLIYTGMGIFMGVVTIAVFGLECYVQFRSKSKVNVALPIIGIGVSAASLLSFFAGYRFRPAVDCFEFPNRDWTAYPKFVSVMLANFLAQIGPLSWMTWAGGCILLLALAILALAVTQVIRNGATGNIHFVVAVLMANSLLFCANAAVGRVCLGPGAALASRYSTMVVPLFLGMYLFFNTVPMEKIQRLVAATFVIMLVPGTVRYPAGAHWFANGKRAWAACYVRMESVADCDRATSFKIYPNPERTNLKRKLDYLKEHKLNLFDDSSNAEPSGRR